MNQMDTTYTNSTVEALILASPEPISARKIIQVVEELTPSGVGKAVACLNERYTETGVSFRVREIAGGYQFFILPEYVGFVEELFARRRKLRLTRAALETAAIVAYRQPVTKVSIEHIRGVASDGVLNNLLEKKLVTIVGRAETVGKPLQYGTTDDFLKFFGLDNIRDLPKMSEIEELIAASEANDQTELTLVRDGDQEMVRLNVADGTFVPGSRDEADNPDDELVPINQTDSGDPKPGSDETTATESETSLDEEKVALEETESTPDLEASEESEETDLPGNRLVLKNPVPQGTFGPVGAEEESDEIPKVE